jgi:hypothetical protein
VPDKRHSEADQLVSPRRYAARIIRAAAV